MGVSILMYDQPQPVLRHHSPDIHQDSDRLGCQVTNAINPKGSRQGNCEDLHRSLLPRMKTIVTGLQASIQFSVDGADMVPYPGANGNATALMRNYVHHAGFWSQLLHSMQIVQSSDDRLRCRKLITSQMRNREMLN